MSNKQTYEIDLKVDGLISNFKRAIKTMQNAGADNKSLSALEKSLESIEAELSRLKSIGKDGLTGDPAALKSYQQEVDRVYKRLEKLGGSFATLAQNEKKFSSSIEQARKELKDAEKAASTAQKSFARVFQEMGFDRERAQQLSQQIQRQEQLNELLIRERQERQRNLQVAREALNAAQPEAGRRAANQLGSQFFKTASGHAGSLSSDALAALRNYARASHTSIQTILQRMNSELAEMIANWRSIESIQSRIQEFGELYFDNTPMSQLFGSAESATGAIERAIQQRARNLGQSDAGREYRAVQQSLSALEPTQRITAALNNYSGALSEVAKKEGEVEQAKKKDEQQSEELRAATESLTSNTRKHSESSRQQIDSLIQTANQVQRTSQQFEMLKNHILMFFSVTSVISIFRQQIRKTFEDVKTLDKSFASIAMVTTRSVEDMWKEYANYANMAAELGQRTQSVIDASALFYQQGLNTAEALELTRDTMKLATLAGIDYTQATDEMTAAIRGFRMEMNQGSHITDVYSTLAANAAASVNEIAQAMVRTSSIANSAGMSFENTAAFLTQMIETTQESAENIGDLSEFLNN